jgi:uncharacterized protein YciI
MPVVLTCEIQAGALPKLKELRAKHLQYISDHEDEILFGGPARADNGAPETMIIVLKTSEHADAERFIKNEPYTSSHAVFTSVSIRSWSQVIPEVTPGALARAISGELASGPG